MFNLFFTTAFLSRPLFAQRSCPLMYFLSSSTRGPSLTPPLRPGKSSAEPPRLRCRAFPPATHGIYRSERTYLQAHMLALSRSLSSLSLSHTHTLSLYTHTRTHTRTHVLSLSLSFFLSLSHSHTHTQRDIRTHMCFSCALLHVPTRNAPAFHQTKNTLTHSVHTHLHYTCQIKCTFHITSILFCSFFSFFSFLKHFFCFAVGVRPSAQLPNCPTDVHRRSQSKRRRHCVGHRSGRVRLWCVRSRTV